MTPSALPRRTVDYAPTVREAMRKVRLQRIKGGVIDILAAIAVAVVIFGAHGITRAVDEYVITMERNEALRAEVGELRERLVTAEERAEDEEAWDCRHYGRTSDGRRHKWCSRGVQQ